MTADSLSVLFLDGFCSFGFEVLLKNPHTHSWSYCGLIVKEDGSRAINVQVSERPPKDTGLSRKVVNSQSLEVL